MVESIFVVLFNLRQVILPVILQERFITPEDFSFDVVATDERTLHDLIQRCADANVIFGKALDTTSLTIARNSSGVVIIMLFINSNFNDIIKFECKLKSNTNDNQINK
jgi:hypothetical protein